MTMRTLAILSAALMAMGAFGCDFYPGSKQDMRMTMMTWDPIPSDTCVPIGAYVMGLDVGSPPAQAKSQIKIGTQTKEQRDMLPSSFTINYTLFDPVSPMVLYSINYSLKNGKGKSQFVMGALNLSEGDQIDVEACASDDGDVPAFSKVEWRLSLKYDKF